MKLDNLKQLIKEEIYKILNEDNTVRNLTLSDLKPIATPIKLTGINQLIIDLPKTNGATSKIDLNSEYAQSNLDFYKNELVNELGEEILNAPIILNPSEVWYKKVIIDDESFREAERKNLSVKKSWLKNEQKMDKTSNLNKLKKKITEIVDDILEETQLEEIMTGQINVGDVFTLNSDIGLFKKGDKVEVKDKGVYGNDIKIILSNDQGITDEFLLDINDDFEALS